MLSSEAMKAVSARSETANVAVENPPPVVEGRTAVSAIEQPRKKSVTRPRAKARKPEAKPADKPTSTEPKTEAKAEAKTEPKANLDKPAESRLAH